jgi:hypothetical protein
VAGSASYAFADKNAGTGKTVTVTGGTLSGGDAGNYTLTLPASALADILQRSLVITADNIQKIGGLPDPVLAYTLTTGSLVAGDNLTGSPTREAGEAPGMYDITQGGLTAGQNYLITFQNGQLTIVPAAPTLPPAPNIQALRATPLPSHVRRITNRRSPVVVQPGIFCVPQVPCPSE